MGVVGWLWYFLFTFCAGVCGAYFLFTFCAGVIFWVEGDWWFGVFECFCMVMFMCVLIWFRFFWWFGVIVIVVVIISVAALITLTLVALVIITLTLVGWLGWGLTLWGIIFVFWHTGINSGVVWDDAMYPVLWQRDIKNLKGHRRRRMVGRRGFVVRGSGWSRRGFVVRGSGWSRRRY